MYSWITEDTVYSLDDGTNFYMSGISGIGMMPVRRIEERGPLQNGVTDRGYRLDPRTIIMTLDINASDYTNLYAKRTTLMNLFGPQSTPGTIRFEQGTTTRDVDGYYVGNTLGMVDNANTYLVKRVVVAIRCPDPTWYDPTKQWVYFGLAGGADTLEVPMAVPMTVGASSINSSTTVTNAGQVKTFPTVRIEGPITGPKIVNNASGDSLDFSGTTIAAGEWYEIDCRYGYKTVEDQDGTNQIADLSDDSDLATFGFDAAPVVADGVTSVTVTGTAADENSKVTFSFYNRYLGV